MGSMPSSDWMSRASSGLSFSAPTIQWVIVLNWRGSQLFKYNLVNEGVPVSSVTLCSLADLADRPGIERVEVVNYFLVQANRRPDRDREAERVEKRQNAQEHFLGLQMDRPPRPDERWRGHCGVTEPPPWDRLSIPM